MNDSPTQTLVPAMPSPANPTDPSDASQPAPRLLRIQEVAAEIGVTTRTIRYYEEIGLLQPAARSEGDYRLYDDSDVQRIRYIRELRDVAGFSLSEVEQMLEDEEARARNRVIYRSTEDVAVRRRIVTDNLQRAERTGRHAAREAGSPGRDDRGGRSATNPPDRRPGDPAGSPEDIP